MKHKEECFIRYPNTEKWVEKTRRSKIVAKQSVLFPLNEFLVSKETVVLRRWERSKQKFGFIKRVDKDLES